MRRHFPFSLWPRRLSTQLALLQALLLGAGILLITVYAVRAQVATATRDVESQLAALTRNLATHSGSYLITGDYDSLEELLRQTADFPDVQSIAVSDARGHVLSLVERTGTGVRARYDNAPLVPPAPPAPQARMDGDEMVYWHPIGEGAQHGWVRLRLRLQGVARLQAATWQCVTFAGGAILLLCLAILMALIRRPLKALRRTTEFAAALDRRLGETMLVYPGNEELERLGTALNRTSLQLQIQDQERRANAERLHELVVITADRRLDLDSKIQRLLELGRRELGMDNGLLARVDGAELVLTHVQASSPGPAPGQRFDAARTYCGVAFAEHRLLGVEHAAASVWKHHPAYAECGFESYLGIPVSVAGQPQAVLSFASPRPRQRPFQDGDREFVRLMAQWIGMEFERRAAEERIRQNEMRLNLALEGTDAGLWDWDLNANEVFLSDRCPALLGFAPGEIDGRARSWFSLIHPDDVEAVIRALDEHLDGRAPAYAVEFRMQAKDGSWRWIAARGKVVARDAEGQAQRLAGTYLDVSARVEMENALREARDAALEVARLKAAFLANMSHEIRTPMNGVLGMTEMLLQTPLTPEQRELAETVHSSGHALLTILNDILDFSRLEAGKLRLEEIDFDPVRTVEDVIELFAPRAFGKGIELVSALPPGLPRRVRGDPGRLRQVLSNLIGNAIKFTDWGEVTVKVGRESRVLSPGSADPGPGVVDSAVVLRFEVTDTGIGIAPEARAQLFQPFTQADASIARRFGGTGLGLAICKELVDLMRGAIGVDSAPGRGSTFWFELPFARAADEPTAEPPRVDLAGLRVLIVDDNAASAQSLREMVAAWGMRPEVVADGAAALSALRRAHAAGDAFPLVLLDAGLSGMDGFDVAAAIEADAALRTARRILLASYGLRGDGERARAAGIAGYLRKPARASQLYDCMVTVLGLGGAPSLVTVHSLEERRRTHRARVLVVEDNAVNQRLAVRLLERLGCTVDVAANGRQAVDAVRARPYDLVFMDCQMPVMDGYEATREIRSLPSSAARRPSEEDVDRRPTTVGRRLPIIAMTANAMPEDRAACLAAGMDDHLVKPVRIDAVEAVLRRWLPAERIHGLSDADRRDGPVAVSAPSPAVPAVTPTAGEQAALDGAMLVKLRGLLGAEFPALVADFLRDTPERIRALRAAARDGDAAGLRALAHTLKGSSANLGAPRLSARCAELEALARAGVAEDHTARLDGMEAEYRRVAEALQAMASGSTPAAHTG